MAIRVLFVCMGNICRSPLAEGVFRAEVHVAGLDGQIGVDSAGIGAWHVGEPPHRHSQTVSLEKGFSIADLRGRQVTKMDFSLFDHVIAMDFGNVAALQKLAPPSFAHKIKLFMSFAPDAGSPPGPDQGPDELADPYGDDLDAYRETLSLCEGAARGLLHYIRMNDLH